MKQLRYLAALFLFFGLFVLPSCEDDDKLSDFEKQMLGKWQLVSEERSYKETAESGWEEEHFILENGFIVQFQKDNKMTLTTFVEGGEQTVIPGVWFVEGEKNLIFRLGNQSATTSYEISIFADEMQWTQYSEKGYYEYYSVRTLEKR